MVGIAISLYPQHAEYHDLRRAAVEAEALGIDVLYTCLLYTSPSPRD